MTVSLLPSAVYTSSPQGRGVHAYLRTAALIMAVLSLGACETWLGGGEESAPLPGKRVSILLHESQNTPDPELADAQILLPAPAPTPDWPQAGGYANHAMHHISIPGGLRPAWSTDIGSGNNRDERFVSEPIVADGKIFTMDSETTVRAFNAQNGKRLWSRDLTPDEESDGHIGGGLAFDGGRIFATTGFAQVVALDAATGKEAWRQAIGAPMRAAPTARGGRVFAVTIDNRLYALSAYDGHVLWSHSGISEVANLLGGASPAVDQGVVVVPYSSGELVALKVDNGHLLWSESLITIRRTDSISALAHIRARPVIDRGRVFAIGNGGMMVAIDLRVGQRIWDSKIGGQQNPWIAGDFIFTLTNDAELIALSREDGRIYWVLPLPAFEDPEDKTEPVIWTGPILVNDRLIIANSIGDALAVSPYSGRILGREDMPDSVTVPPIVAADSIYFLSDNAELSAYR